MKKIIKSFALFLLILIYGCAARQSRVATQESGTGQPVQMNYYVKDISNSQSEVFYPPILYPGKKKYLFPKSKIEVKTNSNDIGIKLQTSKSANSESEYTELMSGQNYQDLFDGEKFSITTRNLSESYSIKLPNNKFLKIEAYQKSDGTTIMTGYFKVQNKYSFFTGFSSPVLFRVTGNAAGFSLNSISPSLGFNFVQRNINNENFDHLSLDLLITITSYPKTLSDSYQYTMAVGGVVDFGGYIQLGSSYSFLEEKPYLVIGIKPYLFSKLFGND